MSQTIDFNTLSKEWLKILVTSDAAVNGLPVSVAIAAPGTTPATFVSGEWVGDTAVARVLIGPGTDLVLRTGVFDVWVKLDASPEAPVMNAGRIRVR